MCLCEGAQLTFDSFSSMLTAPFVIYADLETMICKEESVERGKVISKRRHVPVSVGALTVCRDRPEFGSNPFVYTGWDCIDVLLHHFLREENRCRRIYEQTWEPCRMTVHERRRFDRMDSCEICGEGFGSENHSQGPGSLPSFWQVSVRIVHHVQFDSCQTSV